MADSRAREFLKVKSEQAADHLKRNGWAWALAVIPFLFFGTAADLKLLGWKVAVVCVGCIVFHIVRKQMFPYIDPGYFIDRLTKEGEHPDDQFLRSFVFIGECILLGLLAHAIIGGIASGL